MPLLLDFLLCQTKASLLVTILALFLTDKTVLEPPMFHFFSTFQVIPHFTALVPCPGLTSEVWVVASTSVLLTPTEILNLYFCMASGT